MLTATFGTNNNNLRDWSLTFNAPSCTLLATRISEVVPLIAAAEAAAQGGAYVALMLSYEAALAFDSAYQAHSLDSFPLAWAAVFPEASPSPLGGHGSYSVGSWQPGITRTEYEAVVTEIRHLISAGDTYQVNYTFPLISSFSGDAFSWFRDLCQNQRAQYCAFLNLGRYQLLSISPELFFERRGNAMRTRPMKGTVKRGRYPAEDEQLAEWLRTSPKDRAENVMIVDLLRNDLGKVSVPGSVRVPRMFELEQFETLWQMTSTVESTLSQDVDLAELMRALFPCGSITGAPKIRTMEIIHDLERFPRGAYTGTIGLLRPGGDCLFNVAIRTLVLDSETGKATCGVGGGITSGSTAEREYEECLVKTAFLGYRSPSCQLIESLLLESGDYFLLDRHLARLEASAEFLGFAFPEQKILSSLVEISETHPRNSWKIRLLLTREGNIETEALKLDSPAPERQRVALATRPIDSDDRFLFHKTTNRPFYASQLDAQPQFDDIVFWNDRGEITEASVANVVVLLDGTLYTPPVSAGLLAGTFRDQLIADGKICERKVTIEELRHASEFFLINSVRKWVPALLVETG